MTDKRTDENSENIDNLSFEEALERLENIVADLERGDVSLDESVKVYERGEALKKHCAKLLKAAQDKVEKIRIGADGAPKGTDALDGADAVADESAGASDGAGADDSEDT